MTDGIRNIESQVAYEDHFPVLSLRPSRARRSHPQDDPAVVFSQHHPDNGLPLLSEPTPSTRVAQLASYMKQLNAHKGQALLVIDRRKRGFSSEKEITDFDRPLPWKRVGVTTTFI